MESTQERPGSRLPTWARGWGGRRIAAVATVVVLVAGIAVSCSGTGGRIDVPVVEAAANAGVDGVRAPSDKPGGTLRVVAPEIDSLDPQRSYLPGVWNLMRLYTRTLVTYSSQPGSTDQLVPDLATDLGTPSTPALAPALSTGTSTRPPAPPPQLTARTITRTTTPAAARTRRRGQSRAHAGSRRLNWSSEISTPAVPPDPVCGRRRSAVQLPSAACRQIPANSSASRLAPPTSAPSTSGPARIPAVFPAFTDPP